jgi:hypothetical protein
MCLEGVLKDQSKFVSLWLRLEGLMKFVNAKSSGRRIATALDKNGSALVAVILDL